MSNTARISPPRPVSVAAPRERTNETKVAAFLRELEKRGLARVELRHCMVSGAEGIVRDWPFDEHTTCEGIALRVCELAAEEAEDLPGAIQSYVVLAYNAEDQPYRARQMFRVKKAANADNVQASEPADLAGITAQLMRHNEILMRVALSHTEGAVRSHERGNEMLLDLTTKMVNQRIEFADTYEELATRKTERDIELARATSKANVDQKAFALLERYVPHLFTKLLAGGGSGGASGAPAMAAPPSSSASSPPATTPAPPPVGFDDDETAALLVHQRLANLTDEQLSQMASVGFISPQEHAGFVRYRNAIRADVMSRASEAPPPESEAT